MANKKTRYQEMEHYMTYILIGDGVLFLLYLLFAGFGVTWLKIFLAIVAILVSGLCIGYLYLTGELLRVRSRWMSVGFAAVVLCLLVSLIANYPSPKPVQKALPVGNTSGTTAKTGNANDGASVYFIGDIFTL